MLPYECLNISKVVLAVVYSSLEALTFRFWVSQTLIGLDAKILDDPFPVNASFWVNPSSLGALKSNQLLLDPLLRLSIAPSLRQLVSFNGSSIFYSIYTSLVLSYPSSIATTRVHFTSLQTQSFMSAQSILTSTVILCVRSYWLVS
jgi:hypothetical protein